MKGVLRLCLSFGCGRKNALVAQTIDELQQDLDNWIHYYNQERTHSGKYCYGKTPMETFLDAVPLAEDMMKGDTLQTATLAHLPNLTEVSSEAHAVATGTDGKVIKAGDAIADSVTLETKSGSENRGKTEEPFY